MGAICYMEHPEHGALPVYNRDEIKSNKEEGWIRIETADYIEKHKELNEKKMEGVIPVGATAQPGPPILDPMVKQAQYTDYLNTLSIQDLRLMLEATSEEKDVAKGMKKQDLVVALLAVEFEEVTV